MSIFYQILTAILATASLATFLAALFNPHAFVETEQEQNINQVLTIAFWMLWFVFGLFTISFVIRQHMTFGQVAPYGIGTGLLCVIAGVKLYPVKYIWVMLGFPPMDDTLLLAIACYLTGFIAMIIGLIAILIK